MALSFLDNVDYRGKKPNFTRDLFETIEEMVAFSENYLPDMFITSNKEDGKIYVYNRENEIDDVLGKWRLFSGGQGEPIDLTDYYKKSEVDSLLDDYIEKEEGKGLFSGSYNDLTDKPIIPNEYDDTVLVEKVEGIESSLDNKADKTELHTHENKDVLDDITSDKVTSWDSKATEAFVTNAIAQAQLNGGDVDLSGYATIEQLNEKANADHKHVISEITDYEAPDLSDYALKTEIPNVSNFVEKEEGKGLSTNDFTTAEKEKLNSLENYDDTEITRKVADIESAIETLNGDVSTDGSVAKQVTDSLTEANAYTDQKFSEIEYPVTSVNGQTGDIEIDTNSIGAVSNEEFSTTNAKVLSMETTVGALQTQVETNTDELTDVIDLAAANTEGIAALNGQISTISELANTANTSATEALTKAQNAENTVSIQQSTVTNLSNQVGDIATTVEGHTASINTLQSSIGGKANSADVYTKDQVDSKVSSSVSSVYKYKGNVTSLSDLDNIESPENGHVYFVTESALNYAYTDGSWNPLAGIIDLSDYVTDSDMTTALASKANTTDIKTKTSQLENDSEFVTQTDVEAMLSSAGVGAVQTVNGKYGNVVLNAADVGAVTTNEVTTIVNTALGNYYTKTEVDGILGDIASVLDEINGEII